MCGTIYAAVDIFKKSELIRLKMNSYHPVSYLPLGSRACFVRGLHIRFDGFTPSSAGPSYISTTDWQEGALKQGINVRQVTYIIKGKDALCLIQYHAMNVQV